MWICLHCWVYRVYTRDHYLENFQIKIGFRKYKFQKINYISIHYSIHKLLV